MIHQVRPIYPNFESLPVLEYAPTWNRYLLLEWQPVRQTVRLKSGGTQEICQLKVEMCQYGYQPSTDFMLFYRPFKHTYEMENRWLKDAYGEWYRGMMMQDWRQVEFRNLTPGELNALKREAGNITTGQRKFEMRRLLDNLTDENKKAYVERAKSAGILKMGDASAPWNPVIESDERTKPQILIARS